MNQSFTYTGLAAAAGLLLSAVANAAPVTPTFQVFGDVQTATGTPVTFGGSGIPTDPSAYSVLTAANGDQLVLGLAATPRFANPTPTNDGAGTYTAMAGLNDGTPGSMVGTLRATWNFSYFVEVIDNGGGSVIGDFGTVLLYDLDPGAGTDDSVLGVFALGAVGVATMTNPVQDSQNATFGFLGGPAIPGFLTPPAFTAFDANAGGEYSFALRSSLGDVAINVNVAAVQTPEPYAMSLMAVGALALGAGRLRRKT